MAFVRADSRVEIKKAEILPLSLPRLRLGAAVWHEHPRPYFLQLQLSLVALIFVQKFEILDWKLAHTKISLFLISIQCCNSLGEKRRSYFV